MDKAKKNIKKDEVNRLFFLRYELKTKIFRIFLKSKHTPKVIKTMLKVQFAAKPARSYITKQLTPCLIQGRHGGVYKKYALGRHSMNKLALISSLHNTKIKSW